MINYVALEEVAEINPRPPKFIDDAQEVSFLPMAAVSEKGIVAFEEKRLLKDVKKGFTCFKRGDFLIAKITPCFENGKATLTCNINNIIGYGSTEFHVVRPDDSKLDKRYLYYLLWSNQFRFFGRNEMRGAAGQKRITSDFLKEYKIPLPPLKEQKLIAAILDKADALRRKRQQAIDLTDQLLRSVFLDMFGDPVTNPKGYPIGKIGDLLSSVNYGTSAKAGKEGKYPILRMNNITYDGYWNLESLKYLDMSEKERRKYTAEFGDILFNRTNSKELVGKTAVFREKETYIFAGYLVRSKVNSLADPEYISRFLNSVYGKSVLQHMCKSIVGMANINAKEYQTIKILIPPIDEQRKYSEITEKNRARLSIYKRSLIKLDDLFNALTQKAFCGEL